MGYEELYFSSERELRAFFLGIGIKLKRVRLFNATHYEAMKLEEDWGVRFVAYPHGFERGFNKKIVAYIEKFERGKWRKN